MRTAMVTGGNRGIGHAVCESLVTRGFRVVAVVRDPAAPTPAGVTASSRRSPSTTSRRSN